jgi:hypothetical protein
MPNDFHPTRIHAISLVLIAGFLSGAFQTFVYAGEADSLRWHFEAQRRVRDGGVEASFTLIGADALKIDELEFFYSTDSIRRGPPDIQQENNRAVYYKKVPADTRNLVIYSGRYVQLELWAVAKTDGITLIAQTALNLYGQSGLDRTDFEKLDEPPILPGFNMNRGRSFYAAMTGEPVNFSMRSGPSETVRIYLDGERITELLPEEGVYKYVLPGGRKLATRALIDHHELLFVANAFEPEGADGLVQFSCCLPLYRSMRDNLDFPGGLTALFSAAAISLIAVVLKGRRFAWR